MLNIVAFVPKINVAWGADTTTFVVFTTSLGENTLSENIMIYQFFFKKVIINLDFNILYGKRIS